MKTILLIVLFPTFLLLLIRCYTARENQGTYPLWSAKFFDYTLYQTIGRAGIILPIITIWFVISFLFHRQLIFKFAGARPITRKEEPEIYNIVENLCISR